MTTCLMDLTSSSYCNEIWKDIKGFEGIYKISNYGRVKSLKRFKKRKEDKILSPQIGKRGYYTISLWNNQKGTTKTIHRLIAEHFIKNNKNKREVNHKDGNKLNNNISNLEWVTPKENSVHAVRSKDIKKFNYKRGASISKYKNKITYVAEIRFNKKNIYLGRFKNKEQAYSIYKKKYKELYGFEPW